MPNFYSSSIYKGKCTIPGYLADDTLKDMGIFSWWAIFFMVQKETIPDSVIFSLPGSPQRARAAENPQSVRRLP
jgi:hypothetical protein